MVDQEPHKVLDKGPACYYYGWNCFKGNGSPSAGSIGLSHRDRYAPRPLSYTPLSEGPRLLAGEVLEKKMG